MSLEGQTEPFSQGSGEVRRDRRVRVDRRVRSVTVGGSGGSEKSGVRVRGDGGGHKSLELEKNEKLEPVRNCDQSGTGPNQELGPVWNWNQSGTGTSPEL